jgi:predicted  nucleic acid-binding Zn-ribbon protein
VKIKKYLNKMTEYLNVDKRECASRKACIKKVIKALREREGSLKESLADEKDIKQCKKLKEEIAIVHRQRKKGLKALQELKKS